MRFIPVLLTLGTWINITTWADQSAVTDGSMTVGDREGRRLFQLHCAACHVSAFPSAEANGAVAEPYAPRLARAVVPEGGEAAFRLLVMTGTVNMPGYRFSLTAAQLDMIAGYLKTLEVPPRTVASNLPAL